MKEWFPSKDNIEEIALKMKEAYDNGFSTEYLNHKTNLINMLFADMIANDRSAEKELNWDAITSVIVEHKMIEKWMAKDDRSFIGYLIKSIKNQKNDIFRKNKNDDMLLHDLSNDKDTPGIFDNVSSPQKPFFFERLEDLRFVLDVYYALIFGNKMYDIKSTREADSRLCNQVFSSESIMLDYLEYCKEELLREIKTEFEAVTFYSFFAYFMESDCIDASEVNSIEELMLCYIPQRYRKADGHVVKMLPREDVSKYIEKEHDCDKSDDKLSWLYGRFKTLREETANILKRKKDE